MGSKVRVCLFRAHILEVVVLLHAFSCYVVVYISNTKTTLFSLDCIPCVLEWCPPPPCFLFLLHRDWVCWSQKCTNITAVVITGFTFGIYAAPLSTSFQSCNHYLFFILCMIIPTEFMVCWWVVSVRLHCNYSFLVKLTSCDG